MGDRRVESELKGLAVLRALDWLKQLETSWFQANVHAPGTLDGQHRLRSVVIELAVDPSHRVDGC